MSTSWMLPSLSCLLWSFADRAEQRCWQECIWIPEVIFNSLFKGSQCRSRYITDFFNDTHSFPNFANDVQRQLGADALIRNPPEILEIVNTSIRGRILTKGEYKDTIGTFRSCLPISLWGLQGLLHRLCKLLPGWSSNADLATAACTRLIYVVHLWSHWTKQAMKQVRVCTA